MKPRHDHEEPSDKQLRVASRASRLIERLEHISDDVEDFLIEAGRAISRKRTDQGVNSLLKSLQQTRALATDVLTDKANAILDEDPWWTGKRSDQSAPERDGRPPSLPV
jgi:hypothetical protein